MTRSRLTISVDQPNRILTVRYIGAIDGDGVNDSMMTQLSELERPWEYDAIIDMRRHDGLIVASEIEELGLRWALMAKGRDEGRLTAIVSDDPLVNARLSMTQAVFPHRVMACFARLEEGIAWIETHRGDVRYAAAI